MPGVVEAIFIGTKGGAPMQKVDQVEAVAGGGLEGDRYLMQTGHWSRDGDCQVTLIEGEVLEAIAAETRLRLSNGEHRRNIITRGIRLQELKGKQLAFGEAIFEYDSLRPPCRYLEMITQSGMKQALAEERGGICVRVVKSGTIRTRDTIKVITSACPGRRAAPA